MDGERSSTQKEELKKVDRLKSKDTGKGLWPEKFGKSWAVVAHAFNPRSLKAREMDL